MMKFCFRSILYLMFCMTFLCACGQAVPSVPAQMPDDFAFVFEFDFIEVDTSDGTIKNTFYFNEGDTSAVTDFQFTDAQMQIIYAAFVEYRVYDLPEEIDPDKECMSIPPSYYALDYTVEGQTGHITCATGATADQPGISKMNNRFVKFMTVVWDCVYPSDALAYLPAGPYIE